MPLNGPIPVVLFDVEQTAQRGHPAVEVFCDIFGTDAASKHQRTQRVTGLGEPVGRELLAVRQGNLDMFISFNLFTLAQTIRPSASRSKRVPATTRTAR